MDTAVLSVVRDEKLSVCGQKILGWSNVMRIWVTNKVDEEGKELSWRKDIVLDVNFDKFELSHSANVSSFLLDEENKVAVCCKTCLEDGKNKTTIFVVGEDMYKRVYNATAKGYCPLVLTYVPSLVCIH